MNMINEQNAFLEDIVKLLLFIWGKGFIVTGGELYRTQEQQEIYLKTGKSKTRDSYHLKRLAIDLNFFENGDYITDRDKLQEIGDHWESLNDKNQWGGNWHFVDTPHFERRI